MSVAALKPPLLIQDWLSELRSSDATLGVALSPRANTLAVFTELLRERLPPKGQTLPPTVKVPSLANQENIWLGKIGATSRSAAQFYSDAYITWVGLQKYDSERQDEGILPDSSQHLEGMNRVVGLYIDNVQALINKITLGEDFDEDVYSHWVSIQGSLQLVQTILTPASGILDGLVGEEMLHWLNSNFVAVTKEEVKSITTKQEPWREVAFWALLVRATVRGLSEGVVVFVKMLASHPSLTLRQLATQLQKLLSLHPRSTNFATEQEYFSAHRRWRASVRSVREQIKVLDQDEGRDDWRESMNDLVGILEGNKDIILKVCDEDYGGYGWREAVAVWGIWVDVETRRPDLPDILAVVNEALPIDSSELEELVQAALISQQLKRFIHRAADFDVWLAAHAADVLVKLGFTIYATPISPTSLPEPGGDIAGDQAMSELDDDGRQRMTLCDYLLMDFAGTILHGDPAFWRVELDYLSVCGTEGRARMGAVLSRMAFNVSNEPEEAIPSRRQVNGILEGTQPESDGADDTMEQDEEANPALQLGKLTGMRRAAAIAEACKEYELVEEFRELCKVVSRRLVEERRYGEAIAYSRAGEDYRSVGRIVDMVLNEYIERGVDEFLAIASDVPGIDDLLPDQADPFFFDSTGALTLYGARLSFLSGFAQFHRSYRDGDKREAAHLLVRMLNGNFVPKSWWGLMLVDAAELCEDEQLWFSEEDTYDLLRTVEEISTRSEQGRGSAYLGALSRFRSGDQTREEPVSAIKQLEVVRLALARYLARVFTAPIS